jgi:ABC-2 type transport system ATP-binding protein
MNDTVLPSPARPASRLPENGAPIAIEASGLTKIYPGNVQALNGLSISVPSGAIFGLLGPNGAGKSTTVKILTTLSKPNSGSARVAGFDVLTQSAQVRRAIGVVNQKSGVDIQLTGYENLRLQGQVYGIKPAELKRRIDELLTRFRLTEAAKRVARTYSGGMQRKLDIAMGLIQRPRVLFLDEPTTGLDPEARAELWAEIARLSSVDGMTILLTTHYLEEADRLAGKIAIVDRGRVVVEGAPEALKGELRGDAIHIELPETHAAEQIRLALMRVPGVTEIVVDNRTAHARVDRGATAVPAALTALEAAGIPVGSVTVSRPSLDDVYLRYAGRAYGANANGVHAK